MIANDDTPPPAQENPPQVPSDDHEPDSFPFPIVGVGASAGGLEAFRELLEHLSPDPGLAFLFVIHLEPHHKSQLQHILSKVSPIPIREAAEGLGVEVNHVYLIPPNTNMALTDGRLTLTPRSPVRGQHMPIDHLFRSLAGIRRSQAIGVLLSGGGSDGTLGFHAIKAEGGITFAQEESSAKHDSMPRSAILDGSVDYVLPPKGIAQQLLRIARHPYTRLAGAVARRPPEREDVVLQIVNLLRAGTDVDFTHYKRSTIGRRIQRRMALRGLENTEEYLHLLRTDPGEMRQLYQDFLIRVTQFFRDPEAFEAFKETVFPRLINGRSPGSALRIWVAGCSTGEEVYSLAISLLEYLGGRPDPFPIKILATDLNEAALEKARTGAYIENIEIDVSPERLRRFFVRIDGQYQISKAVRDFCVFSRHNMAQDPPFSHLDLVSCRNVLIYMDTPLQQRVLPVLHYALNPNGFLFLGASENTAAAPDLFEPLDSKHRIFTKKPASRGMLLDFANFVHSEGTGPLEARVHRPGLWTALDVQKEADRLVLSRYAPVGVVTDENMIVLQFRGHTGAYLEPAPGMASLDLFRMLREGLLSEVRTAVNRAKVENTPVTREGVRIVEGNRIRLIKVEVTPFKVPPSGSRCFLILFQDIPSAEMRLPAAENQAEGEDTPSSPDGQADQQVAQLQQEITALREYLQSVVEEQESTNEELKSANEEILSANEELQSTNEELQTAKEEAQSANEELATVNEELRHRNVEQAKLNNDLINLLSGVNIPIVMVSRDLKIRRFTPLAEKLFNLIPTDIGRPISDIQSNLAVPDLSRMVAEVVEGLVPVETEIRDREGRWYSLRIRPYVTQDSKIDGASIVLVDIDALRRRGEQAKSGEQPPPV
jgi:two-component system CheB/CheR fusion protein